MRKISVLLFIALSIVSCKDDDVTIPTSHTVDLDQEFVVHLNDSIMLREDPSFFFSLIEIVEDSRCPENAVCIWEGQMTARFSCPSCATNPFDLTLRAGHSELSTYTNDVYEISIVDTTPYPKVNTKVNFKDYAITLVVTQLE